MGAVGAQLPSCPAANGSRQPSQLLVPWFRRLLLLWPAGPALALITPSPANPPSVHIQRQRQRNNNHRLLLLAPATPDTIAPTVLRTACTHALPVTLAPIAHRCARRSPSSIVATVPTASYLTAACPPPRPRTSTLPNGPPRPPSSRKTKTAAAVFPPATSPSPPPLLLLLLRQTAARPESSCQLLPPSPTD